MNAEGKVIRINGEQKECINTLFKWVINNFVLSDNREFYKLKNGVSGTLTKKQMFALKDIYQKV